MLNGRIYRSLIRGLEQQLWFFGQDSQDRSHNLFEEYGFHRYRTPGHGGSSRYQIPWGLKTVELHSFCVGIYGGGEDGFLFVRAHDRAYAYSGKFAPLPGRYRKEFLISANDERNRERVYKASLDFFQWLEHYESWIDSNYSKDYRRDCYERYHRKWLAPDEARKWFQCYRSNPQRLITTQINKHKLLLTKAA